MRYEDFQLIVIFYLFSLDNKFQKHFVEPHHTSMICYTTLPYIKWSSRMKGRYVLISTNTFLPTYIDIKMIRQMYVTSSLENGSTDLSDLFCCVGYCQEKVCMKENFSTRRHRTASTSIPLNESQ